MASISSDSEIRKYSRKSEVKKLLGRPRIGKRIILKWILKE
jgi:hypothetical protein